MGRYLFLVIALAVCVVPLAGAEEWSKTYTISGKPELRVETGDANIRVDTWDQKTIEARVSAENQKIGDNGIRVIEHQTGDKVDIEVRYPMHTQMLSFNWKGRRVDIVIHMPRDGVASLHTGDGNIELSNLKGQMELQTGDGHLTVNSVDGALRARSGDGHMEVSGRFDQLTLETGDGHINARVLSGSKVNSSWELRTGDGSVMLQIPEQLAADLDLHTGDGHIDLQMPVTVEGRLGQKDIHGKLNGGGNLLTIHTGDGSITLEKVQASL